MGRGDGLHELDRARIYEENVWAFADGDFVRLLLFRSAVCDVSDLGFLRLCFKEREGQTHRRFVSILQWFTVFQRSAIMGRCDRRRSLTNNSESCGPLCCLVASR